MLPRINRVTTGADYRLVQRKGRRSATPYFVAAVTKTSDQAPSRFGFVVSKAVGTAVVRNRVRRQLRHLAMRSVLESPTGRDVVVRVLPEAADASADALAASWTEALGSGKPS